MAAGIDSDQLLVKAGCILLGQIGHRDHTGRLEQLRALRADAWDPRQIDSAHPAGDELLADLALLRDLGSALGRCAAIQQLLPGGDPNGGQGSAPLRTDTCLLYTSRCV